VPAATVRRIGVIPDSASMPTLAAFNAHPENDAVVALLSVCSSTTWAEAVAAGRPYADLDALLAAADAAPVDLDEALAGHPRIGEKVHGGSSAKEQAGMASASAEVRAAMAEGNAEYERRFGHVYLVCASGRSADDLLAVLRERLETTPEQEAARTLAELAAINRLRLRASIMQDR
jgi:2-oxo-4-hydroxy-4-carboxy-5-ureidoimidazoline decarboxylase